VYEWERRYELDVAVVALPAGRDPADLAMTDPEQLRKAVEQAQPFLGFRVERVLAEANTRTAEGRARAAEAALAVIGEHPRELVRDQYLMQVADRCRIDVSRLRDLLRAGRNKPGARLVAVAPPASSPRPRLDGPELEALRLLIFRGAEIRPLLDSCLFRDEMCAAAFRALATTATFADALEIAEPAARELLTTLVIEEPDTDPFVEACNLIRSCAERRLVEMRHEDSGDLAMTPIIGWVKLEL